MARPRDVDCSSSTERASPSPLSEKDIPEKWGDKDTDALIITRIIMCSVKYQLPSKVVLERAYLWFEHSEWRTC